MKRDGTRDFHEARWDEPILMELGEPGQRALLLEEIEPQVAQAAGAPDDLVPQGYLRREAPELPELGQMQLLRHYLRLSQETIGADLNIDTACTCTTLRSIELLSGTPGSLSSTPIRTRPPPRAFCRCSMKPNSTSRPSQNGIASVWNSALRFLGIFSNVAIIRAYHEARGEGAQRDEIITTILSHPGNAGTAAALGYKVITLYPDESGIPDLNAPKAAVSPTAALLITNPEDTGIYNEKIREFMDIVHAAGGLCVYDQANLNGLMGITRARDAGFDLCQFNLHKTFSSPHGSQGPGAGAQGCTEELAQFLPLPTVEFDGTQYYLDYNRPHSIGKLRKFYRVPAVVLRAYAYIRSLGADGLKQVSELAILNNNYLLKKLASVRGLSMPMAEGKPRLEQARLSWEKLCQETSVTTDDIDRRIVDYGFQSYFASHHPRIIPEPFTPEACETYSKADIEEYAAALQSISEEAYATPRGGKKPPPIGPPCHPAHR